ncbi:MAG: hypothetical protein FJ088_10330, partial [Deltaproteobacteria bacterium]|nr:hypothetical protein [Deltaproteobacteria bacterium]
MKKALFLTILILACSSPEQGGKDAGDIPGEAGDIVEITDEDVISAEIKDTPGDVSNEKPEGYAALKFFADDSANKTYSDGELVFTGSFSWDEATNIATYATSWLPEDGPYPALYDDGPRSQGGHEFEGAVKGDHIFSTEVWFKAGTETVIEYGALNEFGRWIWIGPNGQVTIPTGSEDTFDLKPLILPKFGSTDFKITLDINNLHADFATITPDKYRVFVKGSVNSWTPVQILDSGEKGDVAADDGIFTYLHSANLGKHDGLLYEGQHAQFVFIFAMEEIDPDDGLEYKAGGAGGYVASDAGVKAYSNFEKP